MTDENQAAPLSGAMFRMAALCGVYGRLVAEMARVYDSTGNRLNEVQPDGFADVLAGSLDELHFPISTVADRWHDAALDMAADEQREAANVDSFTVAIHDAAQAGPPPSAEEQEAAEERAREAAEAECGAYLKRLNFSREHTGGGCMCMAFYGDERGHIWITGHDGVDLPTFANWMVGYYPPGWNGEPLAFDIRSSTDGLTLKQAVAAAFGAMDPTAAETDD